MGGTPSAIISPDGLRTVLDIDSTNQLTGIVYPDDGLYSFEYANNDGLLTAKTEPNGNRFEHFFDDEGRVTATTYTITATGSGGTATDSVTVKVLPKIDIINCDLPILAGDSCTISVHTINGETVSVDQGVGAIQMTPGTEYQHSGTLVVSPSTLIRIDPPVLT